MRLQVSVRGMDTPGGLRTHVERRLRFRVGRLSGRIIDALVTVAKLKQSDNQFNTRCRIEVRIRGLTPVVAEEVGKDPYMAVDRAADNVRRAVARKLNRARDSRR